MITSKIVNLLCDCNFKSPPLILLNLACPLPERFSLSRFSEGSRSAKLFFQAVNLIFYYSLANTPPEEMIVEDDDPCVIIHNTDPKLYQIVKNFGAFENANTIVEALIVMIVSYFTFNHLYCPKRCHFLELSQKLFFEIYPHDESTRSKSAKVSKRVNTLINAINNIVIDEVLE